MTAFRNVLVTGGAGYVGSVLVPKLVARGYNVKVIDLYLFGDDVLAGARGPRLTEVKGDLRDRAMLEREMPGTDAVIHLACISNDPSFELNPALGKSINYDAFGPLVEAAKKNRVKRFIYASSSSVYGIKEVENVTEDLPREPLTDYSRCKALCEDVLAQQREKGFVTLTLRPATVCGYSPRLRLDLTVNILTNHAVNNHKITVLGGAQKRPNLHIQDMTDLYVQTLQWSDAAVDGKTYNAGCDNFTLTRIAEMVRDVVGKSVDIVTTPADDLRSYHVSSERIKRELGWAPRRTVTDAVKDLVDAYQTGKIPNAMTDIRYYNIRTMQARKLT